MEKIVGIQGGVLNIGKTENIDNDATKAHKVFLLLVKPGSYFLRMRSEFW